MMQPGPGMMQPPPMGMPPPTLDHQPPQQPQWSMMPPPQPQYYQAGPPMAQQHPSPPMWNPQQSQVPPPVVPPPQQHQQQQPPQQPQYQAPMAAQMAPPPVAMQPPQQMQVQQQVATDEIRTLWIGDLPNWMDESYIYNIVGHLSGEVISVKIIRNKQTQLSEGYGFIEFVGRAAADRFLQTYNGQTIPNLEQLFKLNWASSGSGEKRGEDGPDYTIFVGDLAADVTDFLLQETFINRYKSIKGAKVVTDKVTGRSKGYGFVRFADEEEQQRAMVEMNGVFCSTSQMRIGPAANKKNLGGQQQYTTNGEDEITKEDEVIQEMEEVVQEEKMNRPLLCSRRPEIIQILKSLHSPEIKIYSDASKEFISLLTGDYGGEIMREYVELSPKLSELIEAWRLHQGKPGMAYILNLVSALLDHQDGKAHGGGIQKSLDIFARSIFEMKLDDIYTELNSKDSRRESAVLILLASIVRRGMWSASQVARDFDFKLLTQLKPSKRRKKGQREAGCTMKPGKRRAFVRFAMSFIEAGSPLLLRSIIQKKELYTMVLREIGSDDVDTICYVLSTLRDKVLTEDSLISPGLRSVLFGSATLEQLINISGNPMAGHGADLAHQVLVMACTDPRNGLMPSSDLKGNEKRLFELMKKLKATEVRHHRELLLAIANRRPSLSAAYLDSFPYSLELFSSSSWFSAISLAADVISTLNADAAISSLLCGFECQSSMGSDELHIVFKRIIPDACFRSLVKGLLHADILVKHGSLRLTLEFLESLNNIMRALDISTGSIHYAERFVTSERNLSNLINLLGVRRFSIVTNFPKIGGGYSTDVRIKNLVSFKDYILDEIRAILPDTQVLLTLLSSLKKNILKRPYKQDFSPDVAVKRFRLDAAGESLDIVISGIDAAPTDDNSEDQAGVGGTCNNQEPYAEKDQDAVLSEIWGLMDQEKVKNEQIDVQDFLYSKLLEVFTLYMHLMPSAFEGSFDFFTILPSDPLSLPAVCLRPLLSLLLEYSGQSSGARGSVRVPEFMYKHLLPLATILICSEDRGIKSQAYLLAQASLFSIGAFDQNFSEVDAWLLSLPGYENECRADEPFRKLFTVVISFLSDAVSTVGNNLYKHQEDLHKLLSNLDYYKDEAPGFSPLVVCILQKCLRLIESDSGTFKLQERSMISLYVSNALKLILQSQVDVKLFAGTISLVLSEKFVENCKGSLSEWRPLKNLFNFAQNLINQQTCNLFSVMENTSKGYNSLLAVYSKIKEFADRTNGGKEVEAALAFSSSVICASFDDILQELNLFLIAAQKHLSSHIPFLSYILFAEPKFLTEVSKLWPDLFINSLDKIGRCGYSLNENETPQSATISLDSDTSVSAEAEAALSLFLKHASFCSFLSAILCSDSYTALSTRMIEALFSSKIVDLLKIKISEASTHHLVLFLRVVLFWAHQILLTYEANHSDLLERLFLTCFALLDFTFEHLVMVYASSMDSVTLERSSVLQCIQDVLEVIFDHPLVTLFISEPLSCRLNTFSKMPDNSSDMLSTISTQALNVIDHHILQFLIKVCKRVSCWETERIQASKIPDGFVSVPETCKHLIEKTMLVFKEKFGSCIQCRESCFDLPYFKIFFSLMPFMSPFDLLELVGWMFSELEIDFYGCNSGLTPATSVCLYISEGALDMLYSFLKQDNVSSESSLLDESAKRLFGSGLLQKVYYVILNLVLHHEMEIAYKSLLKAVDFLHDQISAELYPTIFPLYVLMSRILISCPLKMLINCFGSITRIKAKLLSSFIQVSPLHMRLFVQMFLSALNKYSPALDLPFDASCIMRKKVDEKFNYDLGEDDFLLLLPAALTYFTSNLNEHKKHNCKHLEAIPIFYSKILLKNFSNWKVYVSRSIFQEDFLESVATSYGNLQSLLNSSLLGKAVIMLLYFFSSNSSVTRRQRLEIFESIYQQSSGLLDSDLIRLYACSCEEKLKITSEISCKISFTLVLLSSQGSLIQMFKPPMETPSEMASEKESKQLNFARLKFITILVHSWDQIVRTFPLKVDDSMKPRSSDAYYDSGFLEHFILENIISLTLEAKSYLSQLPSIPFLNQFFRSCLLYRFDDPVSLKALRCLLVALPEKKFSPSEIADLLFGHSQFVSAILGSSCLSDLHAMSLSEALLQPLPDLLKLIDTCDTDQTSLQFNPMPISLQKCKKDTLEKRRLELIKLLRVVYNYKGQEYRENPENIDGGELKELIFLLLSGYGATLQEIDLEMLHLIHEIETIRKSEYAIIAEAKYLWGSSVLKMKKELTADELASEDLSSNYGSDDNRFKFLFRENIPINPKMCMDTVLHFCYDRSSISTSMLLDKLLKENFIEQSEISSQKGDKLRGYDPVFILHFAIYGLVMGFIEPLEFARLGLLSISFMSISSPDEELRKLGYEALGRFKLVLENTKRCKELIRLQLLLTYLQNGITEPWEKIPSVAAIFAAEASFILLDPMHDQLSAILKLLQNSPKMQLKSIPLFNTFFTSNSRNFKLECLWILRLLFAGLNLSDDAELFRRNKIIDHLVSSFASSMPDDQTKVLILQVLKKSIKLPILADYQVMECGLFSWLSSVVLYSGRGIGKGQNEYFLEVLQLVLKVIHDLVSRRTISEWLQDCALEQLSQLSSHLNMLLLDALKFLKNNVSLVNLILLVLASTIRISQKRNIYQPHFTFSLDGLCHLYTAINAEYNSVEYFLTNELALSTILMSSPLPVTSSMEKTKILNLLKWANPVALLSSSKQRSSVEEPHSDLLNYIQEEKESLVSKLMRWITASIILGSIRNKSYQMKKPYVFCRSDFRTLHSLLELEDRGDQLEEDFDANEKLSGMILHLFLSSRRNFIMFPSIISALCILLVPGWRVMEKCEAWASLCSKLCCPSELDATWRWSFDQPCEDLRIQRTDDELLEEEQTCWSLLLMISDALGGKVSSLPVLSYKSLQ